MKETPVAYVCWRLYRGRIGGRRFLVWRLALRWICGSILSGVIRGTQMKCSSKALSLTAALCVCLFSFASCALHLSLTIHDLIIRYNAKVKIHSCCIDIHTVQQLEHDFWIWLALRCSDWSKNHTSHHPSLFIPSSLHCGRNIQSLYFVKIEKPPYKHSDKRLNLASSFWNLNDTIHRVKSASTVPFNRDCNH